MKTFIFTFAFLIVSYFSFGQACSRASENFVPTEGITLAGNAVILKSNTRAVLKLNNNFVTDGPDLHVYLSDKAASPTDSLAKAKILLISKLKQQKGEHEYALPATVSMNEYQYVVIHCVQHNHYYGAAKLGEIKGKCRD